MSPTERKVTEDLIAKMKARLDDPWRPIQDAQNGFDPIITEAETRSLRCHIAELSATLAAPDGE
jgi:hypothetical protein